MNRTNLYRIFSALDIQNSLHALASYPSRSPLKGWINWGWFLLVHRSTQKKLLFLWAGLQSACFPTADFTCCILWDSAQVQTVLCVVILWQPPVLGSLFLVSQKHPFSIRVIHTDVLLAHMEYDWLEMKSSGSNVYFLKSAFIFLTNVRSVQQFRLILFLFRLILLCPILSFWKEWKSSAKIKQTVWVININHCFYDVFWQAK